MQDLRNWQLSLVEAWLISYQLVSWFFVIFWNYKINISLQLIGQKYLKTYLKCINMPESYWCQCPDYFRGSLHEIENGCGGGSGCAGHHFGATRLKADRHKINLNLVSCRLALTCGATGFGQIVNKGVQTATRGEFNVLSSVYHMLHMICIPYPAYV